MRQIRALTPASDLDAVIRFYQDTQDYWLLAEGRPPDAQKAAGFFTDGPPGCDPAHSFRLGLFLNGRLSGLTELSFGFPAQGDAYLGLMLLDESARGTGHGRALLQHCEQLARQAGCPCLYQANPRGRAFWEREGFRHTGVTGSDDSNGLGHVLHRLVKPL